MVDAAFFDFFGIIVFACLIYFGLRLSKYKIRFVKIVGYVLMVIGTLGVIIDSYNVIHTYIDKIFFN